MEEEGIAWEHDAIDEREAFFGFFDAFEVGAGLVTGESVIDAPDVMGAFEDLHAAIFGGGGIDGDGDAAEVWGEDAILVPVAIVLMPGPSATDFGVFHDHFGVVVVGFVAEEGFDGIDEFLASGEHTVDAIAWVIPEGEANFCAGAVVFREGVLIECAVLFGGLAEEGNFFLVKEMADDDEAIGVILCEVGRG